MNFKVLVFVMPLLCLIAKIESKQKCVLKSNRKGNRLIFSCTSDVVLPPLDVKCITILAGKVSINTDNTPILFQFSR